MSRRSLLFTALLLVAGCASAPVDETLEIPAGWLAVPAETPLRSVALDADGRVTAPAPLIPRRDSVVSVRHDGDGVRLMNGSTALTEAFAAIDSFDVSASRKEVVFSALRSGEATGFDIGLVALEGSPISWFPNDPADEVAVQWAPRGNKVSYVIRAPAGDVVRTLHVPTAVELSVPFPGARVHALAWDPSAERYAVVTSTPVSSDQVEVLGYDGTGRRVALPPARTLEVAMDLVAPQALLLRPVALRYEERLPLVVWVSESVLGWNDAIAAIVERSRVAVAIVERMPDAATWAAVAGSPWIDTERVFFVSPEARPDPRGMVIGGDARLPAGRYRRDGRVLSVPPAVVQSAAAAVIAEELKRTTPPNATSSR